MSLAAAEDRATNLEAGRTPAKANPPVPRSVSLVGLPCPREETLIFLDEAGSLTRETRCRSGRASILIRRGLGEKTEQLERKKPDVPDTSVESQFGFPFGDSQCILFLQNRSLKQEFDR